MNTDYHTVATGTVVPLNKLFVENVSDAESTTNSWTTRAWEKAIGDTTSWSVSIIRRLPARITAYGT